MIIAQNRVVSMHYILKDEKGTTIDSSEGHEPLAYIQGIGSLIPGLEDALEGKTKGDKLDVTVTPENGYGERQENMVQKVSKSGFQGDEELVVGMQVQVETQNGPAIALVTEIEGEDVMLDLNHPLAGVTLNFNVEVMDVREATDEELEHGHVHGPGGHHH